MIGARGRRHQVVAEDRLHQPPPALVRDLRLGRRVSILALGVRGLNLGIDFKGGTQISFTTPQPTSLERGARPDRQASARANAVIQGRGSSTNGDYQSFQIRTETLTTEETAALTNDLKKSVKADAFGVKNVSASFGRQIARSAHPRDHRLAAPDRRLHLAALPVAVRGAGDRRARPRHHHHGRHLRPARAGGDDRHGRRGPDRARVLDLRHDHHLRPHPGEHPADEAGIVPADHERLAVGDDPAVARDDVHHAAADRRRCSSSAAPR